MARSSVVVVNILVKPNHYYRKTKYCEDEWRARPLRKRKGQLEGFVKSDRRDFLVKVRVASRVTVARI